MNESNNTPEKSDEQLVNDAKDRFDSAVRETQKQSVQVAKEMGALLRFGAKKLSEAAGKASQAIADDINKRPS